MVTYCQSLRSLNTLVAKILCTLTQSEFLYLEYKIIWNNKITRDKIIKKKDILFLNHFFPMDVMDCPSKVPKCQAGKVYLPKDCRWPLLSDCLKINLLFVQSRLWSMVPWTKAWSLLRSLLCK